MKRRTNPTTTKSNSTFLKREEITDLVREEVSRTVLPAVRRLSIERTEIFSGPIPQPNACREYEGVLPGFTERAVAMAERAQDSDIQSRLRADRYTLIWRLTSILLAFLIAVIVVGGGIALLFFDKNIAGYSVLIGGVAGIIVAMRTGQNPKREQDGGGQSATSPSVGDA